MASKYSPLYDRELWELRADEARVIAENMRNPQAKAMMATVIDTCEQLARRAAVLQELLHPLPQRPTRGPSLPTRRQRYTQGGKLPDSCWVNRLVGVDYSEAEAAGPE
jgi:hypothetical protein